MNQQHAPAPWTVSGKQIKAIDHGKRYTVATANNPKFTPEGNAANARLISAAPELFAALEQAYYSLKLAAVRLELDESTEFYKDIDAAYRALQKAKGEPA